MKLPWFRRKAPHEPVRFWYRAWTADGVAVVRDRQTLTSGLETAQSLDAPDLAGLLEQLEDEGFAWPMEGGVLISWEQVYALQAHQGFADSLPYSNFRRRPLPVQS